MWSILIQDIWSINAPLFSGLNIDSCWLPYLKIASMTDISVAVVSVPVIAVQSFATMPAPTTSLPLFTVPAHTGTYMIVASSSISATLHIGWTRAPLFVNTLYDPVNGWPAIVVLKHSTWRTSAIISSVFLSSSGWISATWSLHAMTFPKALSLSSTL